MWAIAFAFGRLFAAGVFTSCSVIPNTAAIAEWDGSAWSSVAGGLTGYADALIDDGSGTLVTAGIFSGNNISGTTGLNYRGVTRWNPDSPNNFSTVGSAPGMSYPPVNVLARGCEPGTFYAGG